LIINSILRNSSGQFSQLAADYEDASHVIKNLTNDKTYLTSKSLSPLLDIHLLYIDTNRELEIKAERLKNVLDVLERSGDVAESDLRNKRNRGEVDDANKLDKEGMAKKRSQL
jgi:hypothetical protein